MLADSGYQTIHTNTAGHFKIEKDHMVMPADKKIILVLDGKDKEDYNIKINDPYQELTKKLMTELPLENFDAGVSEKNTENLLIKSGEKSNTLTEVVVRSNKKDPFQGGGYVRNACGDYVCRYNVLDCPNHPYGTLPVEGQVYTVVIGYGVSRQQVYTGCEEAKANRFMRFIKGIYTGKEFYNTDYTTVSSSEQMFLPTLFWDYSVSVNSDKPIELSFYTSDISGKFRVIVQGVTTKGVVHGEYVFNVKKD